MKEETHTKASKSNMAANFKVETLKQIHHAMPEMHYHDFYEIYIQDQGSRDMLISNSYYVLNSHDILLVKPHMLHQSLSSSVHTRSLLYFTEDYLLQYFTPELVRKFLSIFRYTYITLSSDNYFKIASLVREMNRDIQQNYTFLNLGNVILTILDNLNENPPVGNTENIIPDKSKSPLLTYVHENYSTLHSINEIADTFYITPSHLCRKFKQLTGYTIIQYINLLKIQKACDILRNTDKSVTEVALESGFNSTMYFCKTFKEILKITPSEYRKSIKLN